MPARGLAREEIIMMTMKIIRRLLLTACFVLLASFSTACAGSSQYMKEVAVRSPLRPPADKAMVVFLRPSGLGFAINFSILDQQGRWIGEAVAKSQFAVELPPGEYMFVGWAENTAALKATLAPGRVYYVKVDPSMGFGSARVTLEAITPRHADWRELPTWLSETTRLETLPSGITYIEGRKQDALDRVKSATENWQDYSGSDKDQRTLRADDGT
jgi:hypothetical protein